MHHERNFKCYYREKKGGDLLQKFVVATSAEKAGEFLTAMGIHPVSVEEVNTPAAVSQPLPAPPSHSPAPKHKPLGGAYCPSCHEEMQEVDGMYMCLTCNVMVQVPRAKNEGSVYWMWVFGFIVFSVVLGMSQGGEPSPGGILVVLGIAAAVFFWAKYQK